MKRVIVGIVVVVALFVGSGTTYAQFVSPGAAAGDGAIKALDRIEEQRRQLERERLAQERLALEERRLGLLEQRAQPQQPVASDEPQVLGSLTRERLINLVEYLKDLGLDYDQLKDVLGLLLLD